MLLPSLCPEHNPECQNTTVRSLQEELIDDIALALIHRLQHLFLVDSISHGLPDTYVVERWFGQIHADEVSTCSGTHQDTEILRRPFLVFKDFAHWQVVGQINIARLQGVQTHDRIDEDFHKQFVDVGDSLDPVIFVLLEFDVNTRLPFDEFKGTGPDRLRDRTIFVHTLRSNDSSCGITQDGKEGPRWFFQSESNRIAVHRLHRIDDVIV